MTLILTCLTKDFVVQASDRRLTETTSEKEVKFKDQNNKALIYRNHFAFAITGMAKLIDIDTIDWAANRLSEKKNLWYAVHHLEASATEQLNSKRIRDYYASFLVRVKRLAFVGAGFAHREIDSKHVFAPLRVVISNFYRKKDDAWIAVPYEQFQPFYDWLPEDKDFELFEAGVLLSKERREELTYQIQHCLQNKERPESVAELLVSEIQSVASENDYVGKDIMCAFVPRGCRESNELKIHFSGMQMETLVPSPEPQTFEPIEELSVHDRIAFLPPYDEPQFVYVDGDNKVFPCRSLIYVVFGNVGWPMQIENLSMTVPPFVPIENPQPDCPSRVDETG